MSADKTIEKLCEKIEELEEKFVRQKRYYDEVLCSLDEGNFSADFLAKLKKSKEE